VKAPHHHVEVHPGPVAGTYAVSMRSARHLTRHWHDDYGFGLMDGGGHVSASGRGRVRALAGHIITVNPGEVHDGIPLCPDGRSWRMVYVAPSAMAGMLDLDGHEFTRPVIDDARLRVVITRVFRAWCASPADGGDDGCREEALVHACGLLTRHHGNRRIASATGRLEPVRLCLLDQREAPPGLAALAELAGLSRYQLVRQFTRTYGLPPFAWLRQYRLNQARRLIAGGMSPAEAAAACGFADQSHLHRWFQRSFGVTPGTWRGAWPQ
jgi:AraC-like DNA-binding protein